MLNILNVAQTGLRTAQTQVEGVMNNIANENTPGYKKRAVNVSEIEHSDSRITGRGISIDSVSRSTNVYLYQNIIREEAKLSDTKALNSMLEDIESIFFETDDSGLSADLNRYFSSIENLRTGPQNEIYKNDVLNNANSLVSDLKSIYESIEVKEKNTLLETREVVAEVNSLLQSIGAISKKIQDSTGAEPNDLLDKRDALELELAKYIDVEISREDSYQIKIGGATAVRFDTNVHELNLIENYIPQKDVYALQNADGTTIVNPITRDYVSTVKNSFSSFDTFVPEVQTMDLSGTATEPVVFLGTTVAGSLAGDDALTTVTNIVADKLNIINTWNDAHPDQEIADIVDNGGGQLLITYKDFEGDVPAIGNTQSNGIVFTGSLETTKGVRDSITYTLDATHSVTVTIGEEIFEADGVTPADIDGLGNSIVTADNVIQALVYQINQHKDIGGKITAYNGNYEIDKKGNKILTDNPLHSKYQAPVATATPPASTATTYLDRYLVIEANIDGEAGSFVGEILINDGNGVNTNTRAIIENNSNVSVEATDDIHLEIYDKEIDVTGGSLNAMIDNIKTDSGNNLFDKYKEMLDNFASALSNYTESYIENTNGTYVYGSHDVKLNADADKGVSINLFSGANVKTLTFNEESLNIMTQEKLDYLADLQWKEDIDFKGMGFDTQSFSSYFQTLRVVVADDRETVVFNEASLMAVKESLQSTYDQIVKVDKDEEMVNLIKFQSAYEANAKVITVVDEMLQTLLGIKR
jgi:flagellar hook-associated protein FlgK